MHGITLTDRVRNEDERKRTALENFIKQLAQAKWNWAGHVAGQIIDG